MNILCNNAKEARRPDIVMIDRKEMCIIIDIAVPADRRVHEKRR